MKKIFLLIVVSLIAITTSANVKGVDSDYVIEKESKTEILESGIIFRDQVLSTKFVSKDETDIYWKDRTVYSLEMPGDNNENKIVTWSHSSQNGYTSSTLIDIAEDYEKTHPGWKVIGGVNGEGFHNSSLSIPENTGEIINAYAQDGEVIKKDVSSESFKGLIGFFDDNSYVIDRVPTYTTYLQLKLANENLDIKYQNTLPEGDEISLITQDLKEALDVTNYNVFKGYTESYRKTMYYLDKDPNFYLTGQNNGIYLKGYITEIMETDVISKVNYNEFYIITKDDNISNILSVNDRVLCQYDFTEKFKNVESMVGYMFKLLDSGEVVTKEYLDEDGGPYSNHFYYWSNKERAAIGFKEDGSIVLLTANTGVGGPSQYEVGEILRLMGCNNAYQFDGGGSVSFVIKNEEGKFVMLNEPADGSARRIGDGVFFVTRDPGFTAKATSKRGEIEISLEDSYYKEKIKDVTVEVNNAKYNMSEDSFVIDKLNDDTKYEISISYKIEGLREEENYLQKETKLFVTTNGYKVPLPNLEISDITYNGATFKKTEETPNIFDVKIKINNKYYDMIDNQVVVSDLKNDTAYFAEYNYKIIDEVTGKTFEGKEEFVYFKTSKYAPVILNNFELNQKEENSVKFTYSISDATNLIYDSYIVIGGSEYQIDSSQSEVTINGLSFTSDLEAQLIIKYITDEDNIIESEIITIKKDSIENDDQSNPEENNPIKKGCTNGTRLLTLYISSAFILYFVRKRRS